MTTVKFLKRKSTCAMRAERRIHSNTVLRSILIGIVIVGFAKCSYGQTHIDRKLFFDRCTEVISQRKSFQAIDRKQNQTFYLRSTVTQGTGRQNVNRIFDNIDRLGTPSDPRQIAYILATAYRETMGSLQPISEKYGKAAYAQPAPNGKSYYGRGFVQLTHAENYQKVGRLLHMSPPTTLYDEPDRALEPDLAARILVEGMTKAWFTKKRLADFFNETTEDWDGARQIVNPGSYRAPVTAGYGRLFLACLSSDAGR